MCEFENEGVTQEAQSLCLLLIFLCASACNTKALKVYKMSKQNLFCLIVSLIVTSLYFSNNSFAQNKIQMVRIAKIVVDSSQLENFKAALKENVEASVVKEPGIVTLYAVYDKERPTHVTVLEIYADADAYKVHLQTAHFRKYKNTTASMVKSLELTDVVPIALESKKP
jgi:quinol monooxygenase YgiN